MPDYYVIVTEQIVYGPFTYRDAAKVKEDIFKGKLKLEEESGEVRPMTIKVKEL